MQEKQKALPATIPAIGKTRWPKIAQFSPVSRETFRKLSKEGKAPQPERMGIRCTFYDNAELHRWLADPINYRVGK
ncbi:helix-turn-helix transcriptional regulator [Nitrosomonas oligotropha]|uniref:Transcriptional regulator, AlpA family n=1 Tax=Nitrosomonas oligotropha TaxID=42354 RepID=A0A1H8TZJ9_9PROT|nr:transcriptional regulator [Nitrosomonas oligotropha]SDX38124.1 transcriptional regulator, AlpA family [Nitrosomonas oligotropha]SEO95973.1 transcriptional regulator, AlpA family [Nitrosomonas oligotropha]